MKTLAVGNDLQQHMDSFSARINELEEAYEAQSETIEALNALVEKQAALIRWYESRMTMHMRRQFGVSSERICAEQLTLFGEMADPPPPPETEEVIIKRKKRKGKREEDLSALPIVRVEHELPPDGQGCPDCDTPMRDVGVNVRREIEIIPAQAIVKEHAVHSYVCPSAECQEKSGKAIFVTADSPKPLIGGSLASPSLVAHIAVQKYSMGMPLYRLEKGFQYDGVNISRQNMSNWVIKCFQLYLISIYALLKEFLLKETYLHADETTVQVIKEPDRPAQTKSYEWVYRTGTGRSAT